MSVPPPRRTGRPPPEQKRRPSGQHPAVVEMRRKLQSIAEGTLPAVEELNNELRAYLQSDKPPAPDGEPEEKP